MNRRLLFATLLLGASVGVVLATREREGVSEDTTATSDAAPDRSAAVLYARIADSAVEVVRQDVGSHQTRTVYAWRPLPHVPCVPDELGFLPSSDGRWLLLWSPSRWDAYGRPATTTWAVLDLADTERKRGLGKSEGGPRLLPHWVGDHHLVFAGHERSVKFDVREDEPQHHLPTPIPRDDAGDALVDYCGRFHAEERDLVLAFLGKFGDQTGLARYLQHWDWDPPEYLLLRPTGIPGLGQLRHVWLPRRYAAVALSPDHTLLALTDAWVDAPPIRVPVSSERVKSIRVGGGRVEVFDAATGAHVWALRVAARPVRLPKGGAMVNPPRLPWSSPSFGDVRWSCDGCYLSFTRHDDAGPSVTVIETQSWTEALSIPGALNAFVVPAASEAH